MSTSEAVTTGAIAAGGCAQCVQSLGIVHSPEMAVIVATLAGAAISGIMNAITGYIKQRKAANKTER